MALASDNPGGPPDNGASGNSPGGTASPCTSVCQLDADETCIGCGRSIDEIIGWSRMSAAEKIATNRRAADRRRTMGGRSAPA